MKKEDHHHQNLQLYLKPTTTVKTRTQFFQLDNEPKHTRKLCLTWVNIKANVKLLFPTS